MPGLSVGFSDFGYINSVGPASDTMQPEKELS